MTIVNISVRERSPEGIVARWAGQVRVQSARSTFGTAGMIEYAERLQEIGIVSDTLSSVGCVSSEDGVGDKTTAYCRCLKPQTTSSVRSSDNITAL